MYNNTIKTKKLIKNTIMSTFTTARGTVIELDFDAKWHTKFPGLWSMDFSKIIEEDDRFEYLSTIEKYIGGQKIEYCKVRITDKHAYENEKELHERYVNKICYLTLVTSNNEELLDGDLEPKIEQRAVIIPEKVDFPED